MPVLFVLDTSLPMSSIVNNGDKANKNKETRLTKLDVAKALIKSLIEQIAKNDEFECFSLVNFRHLEIRCLFCDFFKNLIVE